jgi:hypothetical protein
MQFQRAAALSIAAVVLGVAPAWGAAALSRAPYLQSLGKDRVTILWRTAVPAVQTLECSGGPYPITAIDAAPTVAHELTLTGLEPGKTYTYRIKEGAEVVLSDPAEFWFKTDAGRTDTNFSFFSTGDIGAEPPDGLQVYTQHMLRNVAPRADFGLFCGDIIYPDGESSAYDAQLMTPWKAVLCNMPVWPALGNHDWHVDPDQNFCKEWALPNNEHYYSFNYGNAHFIALDTADAFLYDRANQLAWLRADLAAARGRYDWTFVYYHHPLLTCTYKSNQPDIAADLFPIFQEFKVDMVFTGHAHTYERLFPLANGVPVNQSQNPNYVDPQGTIFIVSGCGGKFNDSDQELTTFCGPTAAFIDRHILFTQAFVYGPMLYVLTFDSLTGQIMDYVSVRKTVLPTDAEVAIAPPARGLHQNVPNPFNPTTTIPFDVKQSGRVQLHIYRPDGTLVRDLVDGFYSSGSHQVTWDGRDRTGQAMPSGAYFCRMDAEGQGWSIKMVLVR